MYEDSQRDMDNKMIDIDAYQEQWKKDRMMVALFDALEDIQEPRPAILDEMIQKRSLEIFPKFREASLKAFNQRKDEIFSTDDYYETLNRLGDLVYGEFRKLTDEEKEILFCSLEYRELENDHWTWYEWEVVSELLHSRNLGV